MAYIGGELEEGNEVARRGRRNELDDEEREKRREERKKGARQMKREKERTRGRKREGARGNLALSRRLLSVWPALPALRAPDGTLLKFIDNHKFRK